MIARARTEVSDLLETADRRPWVARLLMLCLGAVMALGLAPFKLPLVTVLALALALRMHARAPGRRQGAWLGWMLGCGYFLLALQWIVEPFLVDAPRYGWMAPFAILLMAGGLALFWAGAFALSWAMGPGDGPRRGLAAVIALTLAEMLRSQIFTGFPWALVGSVWVDHPIGQLAAISGTHGLTFFTGCLAVGVLTLSVWRASRRALLGSGLAVLAWCGGTLLGEGMVARYDARALPPGPVVRVVQPNETQALKWKPEMIPVYWQRKLDLTAAHAGPPPDVVIWPEVSLPYLLDPRGPPDERIAEAAGGVPVILGAQRFAGQDLRNSLAVIEPDGRVGAVYDKFHLVPFGEYFPGGKLAAALGLRGLATDMLGGFTPGPGPEVLDLGPLGEVLPLICYEAIFPRHAATRGMARPDWIVQITNDAWFGQMSGPAQHLDQARLRAIEQGLPLVRAANTGISAIIDPKGRVLDSLPLDTSGVITRALPGATGPTPYARTGNLPLIVLLAGLGLWILRGTILSRR
ncbi:apolipoprotein N-acyltransferase [Mangrovicoccus algicola]|uniref:Apolipoprotein N-acyltransferase n=1 Tax=Mangrovicoccus algicola TaxID=2771008 RepID=A0A8J6ZC43_9RHOB|nr:apolipoprotein N-acyltransferase [Mangrovicoccus algicola]MBE3639821.1 apolipoprotein N-acyltransferase [Mangrovicoccus algicola]